MITWISEIWAELDRDIIINSFDQCGITSGEPEAFHRHLRHFIATNELLTDYLDVDDRTGDLNSFTDYDSDQNKSFSDTDDSMSESDDDNEE